MRQRKQGTTANPVAIYLVLSSDHVTPATGKTVTVSISKNGGAFGAASGAVSELGNGWYSLAGHAGDRDTLGEVAIRASASGCDDFATVMNVVPFDPYADVTTARAANLDNLDVAIGTRLAAAAYTPPANPTDYARNNAAPSWWISPPSVAGLATEANATANRTAIVAAIGTPMQTGDKSGYSLATASIDAIARANGIRNWSLDEADAPKYSFVSMGLAALNGRRVGSQLQSRRVDGTTLHYTYTIVATPGLNPLESIGP